MLATVLCKIERNVKGRQRRLTTVACREVDGRLEPRFGTCSQRLGRRWRPVADVAIIVYRVAAERQHADCDAAGSGALTAALNSLRRGGHRPNRPLAARRAPKCARASALKTAADHPHYR